MCAYECITVQNQSARWSINILKKEINFNHWYLLSSTAGTERKQSKTCIWLMAEIYCNDRKY